MPFGVLESIFYAIARGVTRAYLDVLRERSTAVEELPADADRARADKFRDAVSGLSTPASGSAAGSIDSAPGGDGNNR